MRKSAVNFKTLRSWLEKEDDLEAEEPKKEPWKPEKPVPRRIKSAAGRQQRLPISDKQKSVKKSSFRDDAQLTTVRRLSSGVSLPLIDCQPLDERVRKPRFIWQTMSQTDKLTTKPPFSKDNDFLGRGDSHPPISIRPIMKISQQLEDNLTLGDLKTLGKIFKSYQMEGRYFISKEEFIEALKLVLPLELQVEEEMEEFFQNLDVFNRNEVSWGDLITHLHKKFNIKEHRDNMELGIAGFHLPPTVARLGVHTRKGITSMAQQGENGLLTMGEDGFLSFWCLDEMALRKVQNVWPKTMTKNKVFDMTLLAKEEKLIISTDLMSLRFFETKVFNFICDLTCLESMPLILDSCVLSNKSTIILFGDEVGAINVLIFPVLSAIMPKIRGFTDSPHQLLKFPSLISQGLMSFYRWKVHNEFISELRFIPSLNAVISCCSDPQTALVVGSIDGRPRTGNHHIILDSVPNTKYGQWRMEDKDHVISRRHSDDEYILETSQGVRSFDYSDQAKLIAAGGLDRMIRIWSPNCRAYPLHVLSGHMKCICLVRFHEKRQRLLISISRDKEIRIWDSMIFNQLYVLHGYHYLETPQSVSYFYFASTSGKLIMVIDSIYVLTLQKPRRKSYTDTKCHSDIVTACTLSYSKMMLITGCSKGRLMVWNVKTGMYLNDLQDLEREPSAVQCLSLDYSDSRVLSGHTEGLIKVWNLDTFGLLKIFKTETKGVISSIASAEWGMYRWTVAAGWGRGIHFFGDVETKGSDFQSKMYTLIDFKNSLVELEELTARKQPLRRSSKLLSNQTQRIKSTYHKISKKTYKSNSQKFAFSKEKKVHIICLSIGPGNRLATGNDHGEIHIWNLITRVLVCKMVSSFRSGDNTEDGLPLREYDLQIWRLHFIMSRSSEFQYPGAQLVSVGPFEAINFWSPYCYCKDPFAQFVASNNKASVNALRMCDGDRKMVTADSQGFIRVWDISKYATKLPETKTPPLVSSWHAHTDAITDLAVVENEQLLISTSKDISIRLWTLNGQLIGFFGQMKPWNIYYMKTWCHPHIPFDILSLPLSILPDSPLQHAETMQEFLWTERKAIFAFLSDQMKKSAHLDESLEISSSLTPSMLFAPSVVRQRKQTFSQYIGGNFYLGCFHTLHCPEIKALGLRPLSGYPRIFKTVDSEIPTESEKDNENEINIIHW